MNITQLNEFIVANWVLFLALIVILALLLRSWVGPGQGKSLSPIERIAFYSSMFLGAQLFIVNESG